jgi:hypothetical protein
MEGLDHWLTNKRTMLALRGEVIHEVLSIALPASSLVRCLSSRILNVGVESDPDSAQRAGVLHRGAQKLRPYARSPVAFDDKQVIEDECSRERDGREARVELREADRNSLGVSQEHYRFAVVEPRAKKGLSRWQVWRLAVELAIAIKQGSQDLEIREHCLAN